MATADHTWVHRHACPDPPEKTFTVGNTVFTVGAARTCMALEKARVAIWQIKEQYHPNATLEEIVCAIQVAIMSLSQHIDGLSPLFFDPALVCLEVWNVGEPTQADG